MKIEFFFPIPLFSSMCITKYASLVVSITSGVLAGSISSVEAPLDLPDFISVNIKRKPSCKRQWNLRKKIKC